MDEGTTPVHSHIGITDKPHSFGRGCALWMRRWWGKDEDSSRRGKVRVAVETARGAMASAEVGKRWAEGVPANFYVGI